MILMAINNFDVGCSQNFMVSYVTASGASDLQTFQFLEKKQYYRSHPLCFLQFLQIGFVFGIY